MADRSISEYFYDPGGVEGHRCGYCGSKDGSVSNGMWTHYLTCEDYRDLIDRGWRRSGKYCYKPVMDRTCCPMYAIRCDATQFRLSRSQKKVLKKMNEYLLSGRQRGAGSRQESSAKQPDVGVRGKEDTGKSHDSDHGACARPSKVVCPGVGQDPNKPACRKAKIIRRERKQQKCTESIGGSQGSTVTSGADPGVSSSASSVPVGPSSGTAAPPFLEVAPDGRKPLEMLIPLPASDRPPTHRLEIKLIRSSPPSQEFTSTFKESFSLYQKYQMAVHGDKKDDCTEKQFRRFLCDSPLIPKQGPKEWPCGYGSHHQQYYIDGKLMMVGVVDVLPDCLSSVYVYYDPDYNFITPGVYSALRELELTRTLFLRCPTFKRYCMGYYVHTCQKMRYKGQYYPSLLLCPESYRYVPIESCRPKLDSSQYSRLNEEGTDVEVVDLWLDKTLVLYQHTAMRYSVFRSVNGGQLEATVREYAALVGPKVASRMLLFLSMT